MKAKLVALVLAAGLGVTGIAMTAQAAEVKPEETVQAVQDNCSGGHMWSKWVTIITYDEAGQLGHYKHTNILYRCSAEGCYATDEDEDVVFEDHNLQMAHSGNIWQCTDCSYYE